MTEPVRVVDKVVLFVLGEDDALLVLSQPKFPEAGLQVPAGTIEEGEKPEDACRREFHEETGLLAAEVYHFATVMWDCFEFKDEIHRRHCFWVEPQPDDRLARDSVWTVQETGGDANEAIEFVLRWVDPSSVQLNAGFGDPLVHLANLRDGRAARGWRGSSYPTLSTS